MRGDWSTELTVTSFGLHHQFTPQPPGPPRPSKCTIIVPQKHTTCIGDITPKLRFLQSRYNAYNTSTRLQTRTRVDLPWQVFPYGIPIRYTGPTILTSYFVTILPLVLSITV
jgi:hypothetical protein